MKTIVILLMMMLCSLGFTQNSYLKISEESKSSVSYPPGTKFELINSNGDIILKETEIPMVYNIAESYTLNVFPPYKKETDVYSLTNGKIELISYDNPMNPANHTKGGYQSNGVSLDKTTFTNSEINKGQSNVTMEFSNGVIFNYADGEFNATLNGETVDVKGKYLITTVFGIIKISYKPSNKEIWWVYEPI